MPNAGKLGFFRRFIIFNPLTGAFKAVYGTSSMPALYVTYAAAVGELKKQKKQNQYTHYEVREVELQVL